jgi:hypothetical protein
MRWWDADRAAFSVVRGPDGDVRGFSVQSELDAVDPAVRASDPVARSWDDDLARRPLGDGGLALVFRRMLTLRDGEALGPAMAALFLDIKRRYMELRPRLTRVYGVVGSPSQHADVLPPLGFAETGPPAAIGDTAFHPIALDFGADSVDGWLARLIDAEVGAGFPDEALTRG